MSAEQISRRDALKRIGGIGVGLGFIGLAVRPTGSLVYAETNKPCPTPSPEAMDLRTDHAGQMVRAGIKDIVDYLIIENPSPKPLDGDYLQAEYTVAQGGGYVQYAMEIPALNGDLVTIKIGSNDEAYYDQWRKLNRDSINVISIDRQKDGEEEESYSFYRDTERNSFFIESPEGKFSTQPHTSPEDVVNPLTEKRVTRALDNANRLINLVLPR